MEGPAPSMQARHELACRTPKATVLASSSRLRQPTGTPMSDALAASTARAASDSTASRAAFSSLSCWRLAARKAMVASPGLRPWMPASLCGRQGGERKSSVQDQVTSHKGTGDALGWQPLMLGQLAAPEQLAYACHSRDRRQASCQKPAPVAGGHRQLWQQWLESPRLPTTAVWQRQYRWMS